MSPLTQQQAAQLSRELPWSADEVWSWVQRLEVALVDNSSRNLVTRIEQSWMLDCLVLTRAEYARATGTG